MGSPKTLEHSASHYNRGPTINRFPNFSDSTHKQQRLSFKMVKLIYFNVRGRAELSRLILAQAGVDYEDKRLTRDEFQAMKPSLPNGQLPAMEEDDGKMLSQSMAIARYLAKKHNLAGANAWESAQCDMVIDCVGDMLSKIIPIFMEE